MTITEWEQSDEGVWRLQSDGRSLSLPEGWEPESSDPRIVVFTGDTPEGLLGWVTYIRSSAIEVIDGELKGGAKLCATKKMAGLDVTVLAPTTPSGRAVAKVRLFVVPLTGTSSLVVIGGGEEFAASLATQWSD